MPNRPPVHKPNHIVETRKATEAQRGRANAKIYDGDWRALSKRFRAANPICYYCWTNEGIVKAATEVDHYIPIVDAPDLRLEWSNLRSSCHECHSRKTATERWHG
jgi:5-methylcytosine-specific restriction protein A